MEMRDGKSESHKFISFWSTWFVRFTIHPLRPLFFHTQQSTRLRWNALNPECSFFFRESCSERANAIYILKTQSTEFCDEELVDWLSCFQHFQHRRPVPEPEWNEWNAIFQNTFFSCFCLKFYSTRCSPHRAETVECTRESVQWTKRQRRQR